MAAVPPARGRVPGRHSVWPQWQAALLLGTITALVFANAAHNSLVADDFSFPPHPESVSVGSIVRVFREDVWAQARLATKLYRPLTLAILQIAALLGGRNLRFYHLTIVVAHVAVTLLVFALLRELLAQWPPARNHAPRQVLWPAWIAALAFGVHPIHTEAVNSVFNGSEVLATLGVVTSLWFVATRNRRPHWLTWTAAGVGYIAALLCKESAVTLPALALLILLPARPASDKSWWRRFVPLGWFAIPLAAALGLRYAAIGLSGLSGPAAGGATDALEITRIGRLEMLVTCLRDFARMIVWPHPLRASYDDYAAHAMLSAVVILGLVAGSAIALWRRVPALSIGIAFFYIAVLPLAAPLLVPGFAVVSMMAERYVYLPSVGAALIVAAALALLAPYGERWLWAVAVPVCVLLAMLTVQRNVAWSSDIALWEAEVRTAPENSTGWMWLTAAYMNAGRQADVIAACDRGLPLHPRGSGFPLNCGQAYVGQGRLREAEEVFRRVLKTDGRSVPHLQLARLLVRTGRVAEADAEYDAARAAEDDPVRQHTLRGEQLRRLHSGQLAEAEAAYRAALAIDPRYEPAQTGLGMVKRMRAAAH